MSFKVSYKREGFHNYMVVEPENEIVEYEIHMVNCQEKCNLLPIQYREQQLYYDVNGKMMLEDMMQQQKLDFKQVYTMLKGLVNTLNQLEQYLLTADSVSLSPDMIYVDTQSNTMYISYITGYLGNIQKEFCNLMEYMMKQINHLDEDLVVLVYGIYHITKEHNYSLKKVEQFMEEKGKKEGKKEDTIAVSKETQKGNSSQEEMVTRNSCTEDNLSKKSPDQTRMQEKRKNQEESKQQITRNLKGNTSLLDKSLKKSVLNRSNEEKQNAFCYQKEEKSLSLHTAYKDTNGQENTEVNKRLLRYQLGKWKQKRILYLMFLAIFLCIVVTLGQEVWMEQNLSYQNMFYASFIVLSGIALALSFTVGKIKKIKTEIKNLQNL